MSGRDAPRGVAPADHAWAAATWEGSRRAMLRRALALPPRERLEVMEALCDTARRLAKAGEAARARRNGP